MTQATTTTVGDIARTLENIAPLSMAQSWDNVGLLVGDRAAACPRVLMCIDLTPAVLDEAIQREASLVMAYHPLLFKPIPRILADSNDTDALAHRAIANGIAVYSPHTALDAAPGGSNDVLADLCGLVATEPFEYVTANANQCKLVTFVPSDRLDDVAQALFKAGAGHIGDYEQCSYRIAGEGTFFGNESTHPQTGQSGRLEKVIETRIEVVVPTGQLPEVVAALRTTHPYEEPGFDVYPLTAEPVTGIGRVGNLADAMTLGALTDRLVAATGSRVALLVGDKETLIERAAVCVGAAGRLPFEKRRSANCDVIVTGEIRHHDALTILRTGRTAIALGHWESERPMLRPLSTHMAAIQPDVEFILSDADTGPFQMA